MSYSFSLFGFLHWPWIGGKQNALDFSNSVVGGTFGEHALHYDFEKRPQTHSKIGQIKGSIAKLVINRQSKKLNTRSAAFPPALLGQFDHELFIAK